MAREGADRSQDLPQGIQLVNDKLMGVFPESVEFGNKGWKLVSIADGKVFVDKTVEMTDAFQAPDALSEDELHEHLDAIKAAIGLENIQVEGERIVMLDEDESAQVEEAPADERDAIHEDTKAAVDEALEDEEAVQKQRIETSEQEKTYPAAKDILAKFQKGQKIEFKGIFRLNEEFWEVRNGLAYTVSFDSNDGKPRRKPAGTRDLVNKLNESAYPDEWKADNLLLKADGSKFVVDEGISEAKMLQVHKRMKEDNEYWGAPTTLIHWHGKRESISDNPSTAKLRYLNRNANRKLHAIWVREQIVFVQTEANSKSKFDRNETIGFTFSNGKGALLKAHDGSLIIVDFNDISGAVKEVKSTHKACCKKLNRAFKDELEERGEVFQYHDGRVKLEVDHSQKSINEFSRMNSNLFNFVNNNEISSAAQTIEEIIAMKKVLHKFNSDGSIDWRLSDTLESVHADMENQARFEILYYTLPANLVENNEDLVHRICEAMTGNYSRQKVIIPGSEREEIRQARVEQITKEIQKDQALYMQSQIKLALEKHLDSKGRVQCSEARKAELIDKYALGYMNLSQREEIFERALKSLERSRLYDWGRTIERPQDEIEAREYVAKHNLHEEAKEELINAMADSHDPVEIRLMAYEAMMDKLLALDETPNNLKYTVDHALDVAMGLDTLEPKPGVLRAARENLKAGAEWGRDVLQAGWRKAFGEPETGHRKWAKFGGLALLAGGGLYAGYKGLAATRTAASLAWRLPVEGAKATAKFAWNLAKGVPTAAVGTYQAFAAIWNGKEGIPALAPNEKDGFLKRSFKWGTRGFLKLTSPLAAPIAGLTVGAIGEAPLVTQVTEGEGDDAKTVEKVESTGSGIMGFVKGDGPGIFAGFKSALEKGVFSGPFKNKAEARKKAEALKAANEKESSFVENIAGLVAKAGMAKSAEQLYKEYGPSLTRAFRYTKQHKDWTPKDLFKIVFQDLDAGDALQVAAILGSRADFIPKNLINLLGVAAGAASIVMPANEGAKRAEAFTTQWKEGKDKALGLRIAEHEDVDELDLMLDSVSFKEMKERYPVFGVKDFTSLDMHPEKGKDNLIALKKTLIGVLGFDGSGEMLDQIMIARLAQMRSNLLKLKAKPGRDEQSSDEKAVVAALERFADFFLDVNEGPQRMRQVKGVNTEPEKKETSNFNAKAEALKWTQKGAFKMLAKKGSLDGDDAAEKRAEVLATIANLDFDEWDNRGMMYEEATLESFSTNILSGSVNLKENTKKVLKSQIGFLLNGQGEYLFEKVVPRKMKAVSKQLNQLKDQSEDLSDGLKERLKLMIELADFFSDEGVVEAIYKEEEKKKDDDKAAS